MTYTVDESHPYFRASLDSCQKRGRRRKPQADLQPVVKLLSAQPFPGGTVRLTEYPRYWLCKLRVADSTLGRGKSAGYRLIYAVSKEVPRIVLLMLYHKKDTHDVPIQKIIREVGNGLS